LALAFKVTHQLKISHVHINAQNLSFNEILLALNALQ
jgi:hypothetical protein